MCSSSKMEKEMENVRRLLLGPGETTSPRAPSIPHRGAGPVSLGTLACIYKNTYSQLVPRDSHISHTHPVTRLRCMLPEA